MRSYSETFFEELPKIQKNWSLVSVFFKLELVELDLFGKKLR
jgi:hypothetical protein